jgi:hypothetical protein
VLTTRQAIVTCEGGVGRWSTGSRRPSGPPTSPPIFGGPRPSCRVEDSGPTPLQPGLVLPEQPVRSTGLVHDPPGANIPCPHFSSGKSARYSRRPLALPISNVRPRSTPIQPDLSPHPLGLAVTRSILTRSVLPKPPVALCPCSSLDRWGNIAYPTFFPFPSKRAMHSLHSSPGFPRSGGP